MFDRLSIIYNFPIEYLRDYEYTESQTSLRPAPAALYWNGN